MNEIKAALFDADGVTILSPGNFSAQYAKEAGFDPVELEPFFRGDFQKALVGQVDLKRLLEKNRELWHWNDSVDKLLQKWFEAEKYPNQPLIDVIADARKHGLACFLATNQEAYRTKFLREQLFPNVFDEIFSSAEIGFKKPSHEYFSAVLGKLATRLPGCEPANVIYFDDEADNVEAAHTMGIQAVVYEDIDQVKQVLGRG